MRLSKEQYEERKARVRSMIVRNPDISSREIAREQQWSIEHAWKLRNIVLAERATHLDNNLHIEVTKFGQVIEELCKECWKIIQNDDVRDVFDKNGDPIGVVPKVSDSDKLRAMEILAKNMKMLLDVKFDSGIFVKQLGTMEIKTFNVFVDLVKQYANGQQPTQPDQTTGRAADGGVLPGSSERVHEQSTGQVSVGEATGNQ